MNKKNILYTVFSLLSLSSTFIVILLGYKHVPLDIYSIHLQSLAIISAAGILDYLFLNRLELAAVKKYKLLSGVLSSNNFLILAFLISGVLSLYSNIFFYWFSILIIRHYLNIRRSVMIISGRLGLSYITYFMQVLRNFILFFPNLNLDLYKALYLVLFIPEIVFSLIILRPKSLYSFGFKRVKLRLFSNEFLYRLFYVLMDLICRVLVPLLLTKQKSADYLYLVNLMSFPVAGYSLCGALIHSHILKNKKLPNLMISGYFTLFLSFVCFSFFTTINSSQYGGLLLVLLSIAAALKTQDQLLISFYVSQKNFSTLKNIFIFGLSMMFFGLLLVYFNTNIAAEVVLFIMIASSSILYISVVRYECYG